MSYDVLIDNREKYSRKKHAIKFFKKNTDYVTIKELPIGDYIFNKTVVFEYKLLPDFVKSVKNGRLFNQAKDQSLVYDHHFIMIVSTLDQRQKYFNKLRYSHQKNVYFDERYYYNAITLLNTFTTVLEVPDEQTAFEVMRLQAKKCIENKHIYKHLKGKTNNPSFNLLINIKHVDENLANEIVTRFKLYSFSDLLKLTQEDLLKIPKVNMKIAFYFELIVL